MFGLLLLFIVGLHLEWIVLGTTYRDCKNSKEKLEKDAEVAADRTYERLLSAEREQESLRQLLMSPRKRSP